MKTVDELASFVFETLQEIAAIECRSKDDYETEFENVFLDFMNQMESK